MTHCKQCFITCHDQCAFANNSDKFNCAVMKEGFCEICRHFWTEHSNEPFRVRIDYEEYEVTDDAIFG